MYSYLERYLIVQAYNKGGFSLIYCDEDKAISIGGILWPLRIRPKYGDTEKPLFLCPHGGSTLLMCKF